MDYSIALKKKQYAIAYRKSLNEERLDALGFEAASLQLSAQLGNLQIWIGFKFSYFDF